MKVFITLAVVCFFAGIWAVELSDEQKDKIKGHFETCVKQEKLSEEDANRLRKKDFANPSDSMKCFGACFLEKVGVLQNNQLQEGVAKEKLTPIIGAEKTNDVINKCKGIKGSDRCDTGYKVFECVSSLKAQILA